MPRPGQYDDKVAQTVHAVEADRKYVFEQAARVARQVSEEAEWIQQAVEDYGLVEYVDEDGFSFYADKQGNLFDEDLEEGYEVDFDSRLQSLLGQDGEQLTTIDGYLLYEDEEGYLFDSEAEFVAESYDALLEQEAGLVRKYELEQALKAKAVSFAPGLEEKAQRAADRQQHAISPELASSIHLHGQRTDMEMARAKAETMVEAGIDRAIKEYSATHAMETAAKKGKLMQDSGLKTQIEGHQAATNAVNDEAKGQYRDARVKYEGVGALVKAMVGLYAKAKAEDYQQSSLMQRFGTWQSDKPNPMRVGQIRQIQGALAMFQRMDAVVKKPTSTDECYAYARALNNATNVVQGAMLAQYDKVKGAYNSQLANLLKTKLVNVLNLDEITESKEAYKDDLASQLKGLQGGEKSVSFSIDNEDYDASATKPSFAM